MRLKKGLGRLVQHLRPANPRLENFFLRQQRTLLKVLEVKHHGRTGQTALLYKFCKATWSRLSILTEQPTYPFAACVHDSYGLNRTLLANQITLSRDTIQFLPEDEREPLDFFACKRVAQSLRYRVLLFFNLIRSRRIRSCHPLEKPDERNEAEQG